MKTSSTTARLLCCLALFALTAAAGCDMEGVDDPVDAEDEPYSSFYYVGCFTDAPDRALPAFLAEATTIEGCKLLARYYGYPYMGLQWYGECWAGYGVGYDQVSDEECNTPCVNDPGQICGGGWRNSIYYVAN